jgi:hypothetical protein
MNKKESLVEDTFIQLRNLENVIAENAQGILASTMTQEIKELVKESLNEQDDEEIDLEAEVDTDADNNKMDMGIDISDDDEMEIDMDMDVDDDTIDLTGASDEEILRVFKAMKDEDGIIVKKENDMLHLSDENENVDYLIQLGESYDEFDDEFEDEDEFEFEDEFEDEDEFEEEEFGSEEENEGVIYELHIDSDEEDLSFEEDEFDNGLEDFEEEEEEEFVMESSKFKSKGIGMGNASKFKYGKKPNQDGGFDVKKKQGTRGVGMGKAKFEYKEEVNTGKETKRPVRKPTVKKVETKEASRTYGNGSKSGRGLRKGITPNRNLNLESKNEELNLLREKNEEYRKALNLFRTKLNEVAVFNSNLAYATRLFTEHSTTKQEKINVLRRFDGVETIKESKNLYKTIKDELSTTTSTDNTINESFERNVIKTPTSGSAANLIESKTYENPQFMRMKDLMSKLK